MIDVAILLWITAQNVALLVLLSRLNVLKRGIEDLDHLIVTCWSASRGISFVPTTENEISNGDTASREVDNRPGTIQFTFQQEG